jgi:hypothetical protein
MATKTNSTTARILLLGAFVVSTGVVSTGVVSAGAEERHEDHRGADHRYYGGRDRGWDNGRYYHAPPVVYGQPNYYPPPVVYGPTVGVYLPGLSIGIR